MIDVDELLKSRRAARAASGNRQAPRNNTGRRLLSRWRGDRVALDLIAREEGLSVEQVRAAIDDELRAAGTSLDAAEAALHRPVPAWLRPTVFPQAPEVSRV